MFRRHVDDRYRWPLALRFIKGAIHGAIILPVLLHAAFAGLIVTLDHKVQDLGLPASIVCSMYMAKYCCIRADRVHSDP